MVGRVSESPEDGAGIEGRDRRRAGRNWERGTQRYDGRWRSTRSPSEVVNDQPSPSGRLHHVGCSSTPRKGYHMPMRAHVVGHLTITDRTGRAPVLIPFCRKFRDGKAPSLSPYSPSSIHATRSPGDNLRDRVRRVQEVQPQEVFWREGVITTATDNHSHHRSGLYANYRYAA